MRRFSAVAAIAATLSLALLGMLTRPSGAEPSQCRFEALAFNPVEGTSNRTYRATLGHWRIELTNYAAPKPTDTFSDPPLVAIDDTKPKACSFDGGVWHIQGFALDPKSAILLAIEASGSTQQLTVHDIAACKPVRSIEIKNGIVGIDADGASIGTGCTGSTLSTCKSVRPIPTTELCPGAS